MPLRGNRLNFSGLCYRVDSGYQHDRTDTAQDILNYERDELDNDNFIWSPGKPHKDWSHVSARNCKWVTFSKDSAKRYITKDEDEIDTLIVKTSQVIASDGDGGFLIYIGKG